MLNILNKNLLNIKLVFILQDDAKYKGFGVQI